MDNGFWITVIGSAAVATLVSGVITEFGRWRERKSRREELALAKAIEMAHDYVETRLQVLRDTNQPGKLMPETLLVYDYYVSLKHLLDEGKLDRQMWSRIESELKQYGVDVNERFSRK